MLRLDWNLLFTIINLLLFAFIIKKFLIRPVNKIMQKRQEEIDGQFTNAKQTEEQAIALKGQYENSLQEAKLEKEEALSQARKSAREEYDKIVAEAKKKADKIVIEAKEAAKNEHQKMLVEADKEITSLVVEATLKTLGAGSNAKTDQALYDQFIVKAGDFVDASRSNGTH